MTLDEALEIWQVHAPGTWANTEWPIDWWAVSNDDGIVAYFRDEADALRFRLAEVNRSLR